MTLAEALGELGVSRRASQAVIRAAFKRLALKHHPDHNPGNPEAGARFHRLCLAYEILRGERAADPSPRATPTNRTWNRPWRRGTPRSEPQAPRPETYVGGAPIHYPTPEDIAGLDAPGTGDSGRGFIIVMLAIASFVGLLAFLEAMSGQPPAELDPLRARIRGNMGRRRWYRR